MDAAIPQTYRKVKNIKNKNLIYKVTSNISKLTKYIRDNDLKNDVCFKFLLHPYNANEVYDAVKLAK